MNYTKFGAMLTMLMILAGAANAYYTMVTSTNSTGAKTELFYIGSDVYARGVDFRPTDICNIYIFRNTNWQSISSQPIPSGSTGDYDVNVGDNIPMERSVAGPVQVTIGSDGSFGNTLVWDGADRTGNFDVVVDCGQYGVWDGTMAPTGVSVDGADVTFCIGFTVVPESVIAVGLIALLIPGMIYVARKRSQ